MNQQQELYFVNRNRIFRNSVSRTELINSDFSTRFSLADTIDKAIFEFEGNSNYQLRSDARFLLKLNFQEAVYAPLSRTYPNAELLPDIYGDTKTILNEAGIIARRRESREISGHIVLLAVAAKWEILKTLGSGSW